MGLCIGCSQFLRARRQSSFNNNFEGFRNDAVRNNESIAAPASRGESSKASIPVCVAFEKGVDVIARR